MSEPLRFSDIAPDDDDPVGTINLCRQLLDRYPQHGRALLLLARACRAMQRPAQAQQAAQAAAERLLHMPEPWSLLGHLRHDAGDAPAAAAFYQLAWELAPKRTELRNALTTLARTTYDPDGRLELSRPALGALLLQQGEASRAARLYQETLEALPQRADVQQRLVEALWQSDRATQALQVGQALLTQRPYSAATLAIVSLLEQERHPGGQAVSLRRRYWDVDPEGLVAADLAERYPDSDVTWLIPAEEPVLELQPAESPLALPTTPPETAIPVPEELAALSDTEDPLAHSLEAEADATDEQNAADAEPDQPISLAELGLDVDPEAAESNTPETGVSALVQELGDQIDDRAEQELTGMTQLESTTADVDLATLLAPDVGSALIRAGLDIEADGQLSSSIDAALDAARPVPLSSKHADQVAALSARGIKPFTLDDSPTTNVLPQPEIVAQLDSSPDESGPAPDDGRNAETDGDSAQAVAVPADEALAAPPVDAPADESMSQPSPAAVEEQSQPAPAVNTPSIDEEVRLLEERLAEQLRARDARELSGVQLAPPDLSGLRDALQGDPDNAELHWLLAEELRGQGDMLAAWPEYSWLVRHAPERQGQVESALHAAIGQNLEPETAHRLLGDLYRRQGDFKRSAEHAALALRAHVERRAGPSS